MNDSGSARSRSQRASRGPNRQLFAGVVPFSFAPDGTLVLLLGREEFGSERGKWSGFAGRPEPYDASRLVTAAREAAEESCGILGTPTELEALLSSFAIEVPVRTGTHFLLPIPFSEFIRVSFDGVRAIVRAATRAEYAPSLEKNAVGWFSREFIRTHRDYLRVGMREDIDSLFEAAAGPHADRLRTHITTST